MPDPLDQFIKRATRETAIARSARTRQKFKLFSQSEKRSFFSNQRECEFLRDLVERVRMLAYAFQRLRVAADKFHKIQGDLRGDQSSTGIRSLDIPPEILERKLHWRLEVEVLTGFIHYETKSVGDMIDKWDSVEADGELQYLRKIRNFFLAHPSTKALVRRPRRTVNIPFDGIVRLGITGTNGLDSIEKELCAVECNLSEPIDWQEERKRNEEILRSARSINKIRRTDQLRLNTFGLREPDLTKALHELAEVLEDQVLPRIVSAFKEAVERFGLERLPEEFNSQSW